MRLLRRSVDGLSSMLGAIKRRQRVALPKDGSVIKANLGCGLAVAPGWINVDGSLNALVAVLPNWVHPLAYRMTGAKHYYSEDKYLRLLREYRFVHHDLAYSLPFADSTVDFLYSSHFLEHLFRKDALRLLNESFRVLKPGGVLRISIPDLEYAISLYGKGEKDRMLAAYFFVDDDDSYYARHKYMYDYSMLSEILSKIGFKDVKRCSFQQGDVPDLLELDNREEESLFVEAVKE